MAVMQPDQANAQASGGETVEELFAALESPLLNYAWRLVGELSVAEDMVQEAFMKLHTRIDPTEVQRGFVVQRNQCPHRSHSRTRRLSAAPCDQGHSRRTRQKWSGAVT